MIIRPTTGYPDEYRQALHDSEFHVQVLKTRHRDAYSIDTRGTISNTERAFTFAVLLDGLPDDDVLDTLEQARNMVLGKAWLAQT